MTEQTKTAAIIWQPLDFHHPTDKYFLCGSTHPRVTFEAMFDSSDACAVNCPSRNVLDLIPGKWAFPILCSLQQGPVRTGALMRSVEGISQKMLTQTLRELERDGFVERISHPEVPPRVEYRLTELGQSLSELARAMEKWFIENSPAILAQRNRTTSDLGAKSCDV
jgi:DNA-binding HxlR family transcriptional regulator